MSMSSPEPAPSPPPAQHPSPPAPGGTAAGAGQPNLGLRAQILATEHWSLLATRGMTWSEVMSRIGIHLTVSSASLVVLALLAQASGFGTAFRVMSIGLAAAVLVLGTMTQMRVINASVDDASVVLAMNRLRAAYVDLDPAVEPYFLTSTHDDMAGLLQTYFMGWPRSTLSHVTASTSLFMTVFNAMVAGTLGALVTDAAGGTVALVVVVGAVAGLGYLGVQLLIGSRTFTKVPQTAYSPTPPA
ncbi:hypothetical protein GCM10027446_02030 [Angustibacter peucedani]